MDGVQVFAFRDSDGDLIRGRYVPDEVNEDGEVVDREPPVLVINTRGSHYVELGVPEVVALRDALSAWIDQQTSGVPMPDSSPEPPADALGEKLRAHLEKAAAGAADDLHASELPVHGEVDGVWQEISPPTNKESE